MGGWINVYLNNNQQPVLIMGDIINSNVVSITLLMLIRFSKFHIPNAI